MESMRSENLISKTLATLLAYLGNQNADKVLLLSKSILEGKRVSLNVSNYPIGPDVYVKFSIKDDNPQKEIIDAFESHRPMETTKNLIFALLAILDRRDKIHEELNLFCAEFFLLKKKIEEVNVYYSPGEETTRKLWRRIS